MVFSSCVTESDQVTAVRCGLYGLGQKKYSQFRCVELIRQIWIRVMWVFSCSTTRSPLRAVDEAMWRWRLRRDEGSGRRRRRQRCCGNCRYLKRLAEELDSAEFKFYWGNKPRHHRHHLRQRIWQSLGRLERTNMIQYLMEQTKLTAWKLSNCQ